MSKGRALQADPAIIESRSASVASSRSASEPQGSVRTNPPEFSGSERTASSILVRMVMVKDAVSREKSNVYLDPALRSSHVTVADSSCACFASLAARTCRAGSASNKRCFSDPGFVHESPIFWGGKNVSESHGVSPVLDCVKENPNRLAFASVRRSTQEYMVRSVRSLPIALAESRGNSDLAR